MAILSLNSSSFLFSFSFSQPTFPLISLSVYAEEEDNLKSFWSLFGNRKPKLTIFFFLFFICMEREEGEIWMKERRERKDEQFRGKIFIFFMHIMCLTCVWRIVNNVFYRRVHVSIFIHYVNEVSGRDKIETN